MSDISKTSLRKFWKYIKEFRNTGGFESNASLKEFRIYFKNMFKQNKQ
jgi:hypothetical protein